MDNIPEPIDPGVLVSPGREAGIREDPCLIDSTGAGRSGTGGSAPSPAGGGGGGSAGGGGGGY